MVTETLGSAWNSLGQGVSLLTSGQVAQAGAIVLGTFVLEDAATVAAAVRAQEGGIPIPLALAALYVGVVLGDLGLYGLGMLSGSVGWVARLLPPPRKTDALRRWLQGHVFRVVFVSRFIPGMRLPTYTTCGFLRADFKRFAVAAVVATLIWTTLLFGVSLRVGALLNAYLGAWRWVGAAGFIVALVVTMRLAARLQAAPR